MEVLHVRLPLTDSGAQCFTSFLGDGLSLPASSPPESQFFQLGAQPTAAERFSYTFDTQISHVVGLQIQDLKRRRTHSFEPRRKPLDQGTP